MSVKMNHKNLRVYKEAKELVILVYQLLRKFPHEEQYALCDQLRRAVISIPSNIAEGMGRVSHKEQIHFLEIAFGSLMEVSAQLDIAKDIDYITQSDLDEADKQISIVAALLSGLRNKRTEKKGSSEVMAKGEENRYLRKNGRKANINHSPLANNCHVSRVRLHFCITRSFTLLSC